MDLLVLLSPFCGVYGNPGQSNYAAGSTFEDSFARYSFNQRRKAASMKRKGLGQGQLRTRGT
ncbi:hypothetical protein LZ30DRAFT_739428 [Colletotrichum cereale]|nr:hypothetical protein LZ30DRAFT_739428 [Colletotrichum cereale]